MPITAHSRCCELSRDRQEPMAGTSPVIGRWLLIEVDRAWAPDPLDSAAVAGLRDLLAATGRDLAASVHLIRAHDRQAQSRAAGAVEEEGRRWWVVDVEHATARTGRWRDSGDLLSAVEALSDATPPADPADFMILVCTHATRDRCCAIEGRALAKELTAAWPTAVWETSHLGGHRFAPTIALLPDGSCYGRVPLGSARRVIEEHLLGRPDPALLRGSSRWTPPVQAAVIELLRQGVAVNPSDIALLTIEDVGPLQWEVTVRTTTAPGAGSHTVLIDAERAQPTRLSCRGETQTALSYTATTSTQATPERLCRGRD